MSPPSKDNHQEKQQEKNDKETRLSVEEQGGTCSNPALHQELNENECKVVLFMQAGLGKFVQQLFFTSYFMFGTGPEIEKQFTTIKEFEETKNSPGIPVHFLEISPDKDNIFFLIQLCGKKIKMDVKVDPKSCYLQLEPSLALVSIYDIEEKSRNCLHGTQPQDMQLHDPKVPASIPFSLLCNTRNKSRTATYITMIVTAIDEADKENCSHMVKKRFSVCFYDKHADSQKNPNAGNPSLMSSNYKKILEDNHSKICLMIKDWRSLIQWFVINGRLDKRFLEFLNNGSLSEEKKGEILRNLYEAENIFTNFIEALKSSGGNEEVVDFLLQCTASMENQNSSLE